MTSNNRIELKLRLKELVIDYLVILVYLFILFLVSITFYFLVLGGIPQFSEWHSQLIATCTSVIPVILIFAFQDYHGGSLGKKKAGLKLYFTKKSIWICILRNVIKFLPWQLGHMGTIRGMYANWDLTSLLLQNAATILLLVMLVMGFLRKDKRHLGDLLAGTQVQK